MDCFRSQDRAESPSQKFGIKKKKNENAQNIKKPQQRPLYKNWKSASAAYFSAFKQDRCHFWK